MGGNICDINNRKTTNIWKEIIFKLRKRQKSRKMVRGYELPIYKSRNRDDQQHMK